jgi:hypothetical protein
VAVCGSERRLLCCCVAVSLWGCVVVCGTALHWTVAAAVSGSSRAAAVVLRRSVRNGCGAVSRHVWPFVRFRRVAAALGRCASVVVCVDTRDACGCVSTLRLGCQTPSCCCSACVGTPLCVTRGTRGIHWLFSVAVLLFVCTKRLFARAWYRCVSRCDVRDRRSVTALSSGMTASGTRGLPGCVLFWGVTRTRCCA